jgi:hypothetical protein
MRQIASAITVLTVLTVPSLTLGPRLTVSDAVAQSVTGKSGKWAAELRWRPRQDGSRVLWIMFEGRNNRYDDGGDFGFSKKVNELTGLAANDSRWSGPANFELRRDAGIIRFNGRFEEGWGEGTYRFEGDSRFLKALDLAHVEDIDEDELFAMAIHDVRTDWVQSLQQAGVSDIDAGELLAMQIHGVTPEFVRELKGLGYNKLPADKLIALRVHGATPEYVRDMKARGILLPDLDDLISFRVHNVSPGFIKEIGALGYQHVDPDDLVSMKIHGVTPQFIQSMVDVGLKNIDIDELVAFRIHGVDEDFIRDAVKRGVDLDPDDLVQYRIMGRKKRP